MHYSIVQHNDYLLAERRHEASALDTTLLATDQQRSVLNTLKTNQLRKPIAYTPYGHHPALSGLLNPLAFNGEKRDPVTGWYLLGNGHRPFNPVLMIFTSPDDLSPFGAGGLNPNSYCLGDPVNRRDPTGRFSTAISKSLLAWLSRARNKINSSSALASASNSKSSKVIETVSVTNTVETSNASGRFLNKIIDEKQLITLHSDNTLRYTNLNPTLKELSYSKLKPAQLAEFNLSFRKQLTNVDDSVDIVNFGNAVQTKATSLRAAGDSNAFRTAKRKVLQSAIRGEVEGFALNSPKMFRLLERLK